MGSAYDDNHDGKRQTALITSRSPQLGRRIDLDQTKEKKLPTTQVIFRGPRDLPDAFAAIADWHADGLVTFTDGMLFRQRERVVELALKNKLPSLYPEAEFVAAGGLASYGPNLPELFVKRPAMWTNSEGREAS